MRNTFNDWYTKKMRATEELADETDRVQSLLGEIQSVAIVGISRNRHKDSHFVGRYLQNAGYRIFPVNPGADQILGVIAYPDLQSIPDTVDAVDLFIRPENIPEIVDQALELKPKVIWLQLGTGSHPEQIDKAAKHGITLVHNRCMKVDHQFLIRDQQVSP